MNNPQSTLYTRVINYFNKIENKISREDIMVMVHALASGLNDTEIKEVIAYACDALGVELIETEITPEPHAGVIVSDEMKSYLK